jgi:serine/threonine-protein kinase
MSQSTTQSPPRKEVKIGEYIVNGKIGQGGIAEIYRAVQPSLNREVAIKILSKSLCDNDDIVRRFERESLVIAKLNHPNIVHVIDKGTTGGRYYFVMEYINGSSLRQVMDSDKILLKTKLEAIVEICKGLDYAHKNDVIHRDIKPANILIDKQGNVLITDFGIAQIVGNTEGDDTSTNVVMGTVAYMSPEQKQSSRNVDQTTDIYAVGVMVYEILCGKKPLGHFKPPSEINQDISKKFDQIIHKCLAQDRADRFQTAVALKDALLNAMDAGRTVDDAEDFSVGGSDSFMGRCKHLDTIKETRYNSTMLVENQSNNKLYIIKKHSRGEAGRKEAKLLTSLRHNNVIKVHGSGGDKKNTIVISEYAQGGSLADRLAKKYSWEEAFKLGVQIAEGLDFAHKNNITHGNIRPSNILFDSEETVKLADFGMPAHYTEHGMKENWFGPPERKVSKVGDIYSVGVIIHHLLAGQKPAYNSNKLFLGSLRQQLPEKIAEMLSKLLAIRVSQRYQSCDEFVAEFDDFEQQNKVTVKKPVERPVATPTPIAKTPTWQYVVFGVVVVIALFVGMYVGGMLN